MKKLLIIPLLVIAFFLLKPQPPFGGIKVESNQTKTLNSFKGSETVNKGIYKIEIKSVEPIGDGIQVFAKAWKNGKPLGFGDGSVEIERFRIWNQPILVDDPNGNIVKQRVDEIKGLKQWKQREDPAEALRQSLLQIIKIVGKENTKITEGKVGNTTDTFYPNAGSHGSVPVDGFAYRNVAGVGEAYSTIKTSNGNNSDATAVNSAILGVVAGSTANQYRQNYRPLYGFDITAIPDTDTITSATFSAYFTTPDRDFVPSSGEMSANLYQGAFTVFDDLNDADYQLQRTPTDFGATAFSTTVAFNSVPSGGYQAWALNATGITYLGTKVSSGTVSLSLRDSVYDAGSGSLTGGTAGQAYRLNSNMADNGSNEPMLVIVHTGAVTDTSGDIQVINN